MGAVTIPEKLEQIKGLIYGVFIVAIFGQALGLAILWEIVDQLKQIKERLSK